MSDFLFAAPWWLVVLLGLIGIVLAFNGVRGGIPKVRNIGAGVVLLALVWGLLCIFVDTDKKKVERGTREFVQAAVEGDWNKFGSHLAPSAEVIINDSQHVTGSAFIVPLAQLAVKNIRLKSAHIRNLTLEQTGPVIIARFEIFSEQESLPPTEISTWQFEWRREDKTWKLREIRLVNLNGIPGSQIPEIPRGH